MTGLIYILAPAFSGSTLLAGILGNSLKITNLGEMNMLENDYYPGKKCSCGSTVDKCPFWAPLIEKARYDNAVRLGRNLDFSKSAGLAGPDQRNKGLWVNFLMLLGYRAERIWGSKEIDAYSHRHDNFVTSVGEITGAEWVVDASKSSQRLSIFLDRWQKEIRVIYLTRRFEERSASRLFRLKKRRSDYSLWLAGIYVFRELIIQAEQKNRLRRISLPTVVEIDLDELLESPASVESRLSDSLGLNVDFGLTGSQVCFDTAHVYTGNIWMTRRQRNTESSDNVALQRSDRFKDMGKGERFLIMVGASVGRLLRII